MNTTRGDSELWNYGKVSGDERWDGVAVKSINCPDIDLDYQKLLSGYMETQPKLKSSASTYKADIRTFDGPVIGWISATPGSLEAFVRLSREIGC